MSISIKLNPSLSLQEGLKIPISWAKSLPSYDINVLAILRLQNLTHQFFETTGLLLQRLLGAKVLELHLLNLQTHPRDKPEI